MLRRAKWLIYVLLNSYNSLKLFSWTENLSLFGVLHDLLALLVFCVHAYHTPGIVNT